METYTLDELPLDDPDGRWFHDKSTGMRIRPAFSRSAAALPGRDGALPVFGSPFGEGSLTISLIVSGSTAEEMKSNVEFMLGFLSQRYRTMELVHSYGSAIQRVTRVQVPGSIEPVRLGPRDSKMRFECTVPYAYWRDLASVDSAANITTTTATTALTALAGSTGPINDSLIRFKGAFSSVTITDPVSGDQITINAALAGTEYLVVDAANWVARKHTTDSWSTAAGANAITSVVSNRGAGPMLALNPDFSTGAGRVRVQVKGTNPVDSPTVEIRAKRSFL